MLKKKLCKTPSTRFANFIKIYDNFINKNKSNKKLSNKNFKKKIFYSLNKNIISILPKLYITMLTKNFSYNKKPYQLLINIKTIFNQSFLMPGIEFLNPGKKLFNLTKNFNFKKVKYLGSYIYLQDLPHNLFICFIMNNNNNKITYIKSSGTFGTKLKGKKTIKLILVKLPSENIFLYNKLTKCYIGKNTNFLNNKFIEGKWGFSLHRLKKINVRGVAKNPVDHPNGGRGKTKQPEKSPWGWIAKQNK